MNDSGAAFRKTLQRRRLYRLWPAAALLLAAVAGVLAWRHFAGDPQAAVATVVVQRGDIERTVTAVGSLEPKEYVDVGAQVSGQLQKIHVEIGDRVEKGELIAEIDPVRYESAVRNDRATLESLRAQLVQREAEAALARQQLARNERMAASRAVSQDAVEQAQASARVAEAAVAVLKAQIKAGEATLAGNLASLGYTKIYAPMAGTVVARPAREGQTVNATQSAPVIVQVADLDVMTVWGQVAEADVNRIRPGMPAYFTTLGMPGKRWQGSVRQIQPTPETENNVVLYNVLIDVDNAEQLLLPSMTVQTFFVLGAAQDVPLVPLNALTPDREAGPNKYRATVLTADGPQQRVIEVGVTNRTSAQVTSGLEVGDRIVVPGAAPAEERPQARSGSRQMMPRL